MISEQAAQEEGVPVPSADHHSVDYTHHYIPQVIFSLRRRAIVQL